MGSMETDGKCFHLMTCSSTTLRTLSSHKSASYLKTLKEIAEDALGKAVCPRRMLKQLVLRFLMRWTERTVSMTFWLPKIWAWLVLIRSLCLGGTITTGCCYRWV